MSLKVTFELEDKDLQYFKRSMKEARAKAVAAPEAVVIEQASSMIETVRQANVPLFVQERISKLASLIDMLADDEWALADVDRKNVVAALAYFADPHDIIPDNIPVLGYIDDAIMIELVVKELKPVLDAFEDFMLYKAEEKSRNRNPDSSRDEWLAVKRRDLHSRMRRRRQAVRSRNASRGGSGRPSFRLF
jgi:uncharacterized membrane protein YkvA (DUF1232 family)